MAKTIKKKVEKTVDDFVPDLSLEKPSGLDDALKGLDEPVIIPDDISSPIDLSMGTHQEQVKTKRTYTKRKKVEDAEEITDLVDGEDIQMFIDLAVPTGIAFVHNMVNKEKISPDAIMLTAKQEEKMNRLAQRVAERMKVKMSPGLGLAIGVVVAYGGNYMKNKP